MLIVCQTKNERKKRNTCLLLTIISVEDTADNFLERVWKYFDESKNKELNYLDYTLVAKGLSVYAAGPIKLSDLEYVI